MKTTIHPLAAILVMALLTTVCPAQEVVPAGKARDDGKTKDASPKQPNIIIYMVDDLGWNHISAAKATLGTHKAFYHTPNIEKLARHGVTFTHAYAGGKWQPSDKEHPLDGYSFADVLHNPDIEREREPIFYLFPGYLDIG